jgi:hypothetical protein
LIRKQQWHRIIRVTTVECRFCSKQGGGAYCLTTETCLFAKHNYLVDSVMKILGPDWFKKNIVFFHFLFSVLIIKMSSWLHCFLSLKSYIGNSENNKSCFHFLLYKILNIGNKVTFFLIKKLKTGNGNRIWKANKPLLWKIYKSSFVYNILLTQESKIWHEFYTQLIYSAFKTLQPTFKTVYSSSA